MYEHKNDLSTFIHLEFLCTAGYLRPLYHLLDCSEKKRTNILGVRNILISMSFAICQLTYNVQTNGFFVCLHFKIH